MHLICALRNIDTRRSLFPLQEGRSFMWRCNGFSEKQKSQVVLWIRKGFHAKVNKLFFFFFFFFSTFFSIMLLREATDHEYKRAPQAYILTRRHCPVAGGAPNKDVWMTHSYRTFDITLTTYCFHSFSYCQISYHLNKHVATSSGAGERTEKQRRGSRGRRKSTRVCLRTFETNAHRS